jgi:hypothetical protein
MSKAKSPSADHKVMFYSCLSDLPHIPQVSHKLLSSLPTMIQKETAEPALVAAFQTLSTQLKFTATDTTLVTQLSSFFTSGISDSKSLTRKLHLTCLESSFVGAVLESLSEPLFVKLVETCIKVIDKVSAAGIALLDPKKESPFLVEGYLAVSWLLQVVDFKTRAETSTISKNFLK